MVEKPIDLLWSNLKKNLFIFDFFFKIFKILSQLTRTYQTLKGPRSTQRFITQASELFYAEMFYNKKIKHVPVNLEQDMTPLILAVWYMDDGSIKEFQSNTQNFKKQDVDCQIFKTKFDIDSWKRPDSDGYRIYVSGKSYEKLGALITPFLTEDMWYKWPSLRKKKDE